MIVPVAVASEMVSPSLALLRVTVRVSSPSTIPSPVTATETVLADSPGANVSVPLPAV